MTAESGSIPTSEESIPTADCPDLRDQDSQELIPRLPPEIEYEIFVLAFKSQGAGRTNLLCVARRVRDWLIPLIYNALVFGIADSDKLPTLSAFQLYGHHIHQLLLIHVLPIPESQIFKYCPNIWNLGFWVGASLNEGVFGLKGVKRLVLNDLDFFRAKEPEEGGRWCSTG
ncbi:hypothetical protein BDN72DRAFT_135462 [Pluteus cervinus]|uniref:Uncharacterized protein n=1 Tax=Pluteus cervinus TaxID=181527 RepID=A0ACD3B8G3_9AGAR|nr:hypothetical protein BDN72DRAFT_135462 [Pluteus cervinus]